jgi:hypothetical protein
VHLDPVAKSAAEKGRDRHAGVSAEQVEQRCVDGRERERREAEDAR